MCVCVFGVYFCIAASLAVFRSELKFALCQYLSICEPFYVYLSVCVVNKCLFMSLCVCFSYFFVCACKYVYLCCCVCICCYVFLYVYIFVYVSVSLYGYLYLCISPCVYLSENMHVYVLRYLFCIISFCVSLGFICLSVYTCHCAYLGVIAQMSEYL